MGALLRRHVQGVLPQARAPPQACHVGAVQRRGTAAGTAPPGRRRRPRVPVRGEPRGPRGPRPWHAGTGLSGPTAPPPALPPQATGGSTPAPAAGGTAAAAGGTAAAAAAASQGTEDHAATLVDLLSGPPAAATAGAPADPARGSPGGAAGGVASSLSLLAVTPPPARGPVPEPAPTSTPGPQVATAHTPGNPFDDSDSSGSVHSPAPPGPPGRPQARDVEGWSRRPGPGYAGQPHDAGAEWARF